MRTHTKNVSIFFKSKYFHTKKELADNTNRVFFSSSFSAKRVDWHITDLIQSQCVIITYKMQLCKRWSVHSKVKSKLMFTKVKSKDSASFSRSTNTLSL